jgi:hypothetical protein
MPPLKPHQRVCVFLVFSLVYNPFVSAPRQTGGLEVGHPMSHRATVGASELQHYTTVTSQELTGFAGLAPAKAPVLLPTLSEVNILPVSRAPHSPQQFLCASLWFRPPPAS